MKTPRARRRDDRDFDTTSLHAGVEGAKLHRDYTAHWHRWSFARRWIKKTDHVLEIGCGQERPLWRMLFNGMQPLAASYTGVDLNPLEGGVGASHKHSSLLGEFNFARDWIRLRSGGVGMAPAYGFDVVVHLEVIEHMKTEHGRKLLHGAFQLLRPGGIMLMSTPVYDGKRHAANHIHEYTVPELQRFVERAGFVVERRFGTFMDLRALGAAIKAVPEDMNPGLVEAVRWVRDGLSKYYDNDALACIFAPLFPDYARNNLWVCRRPEGA